MFERSDLPMARTRGLERVVSFDFGPSKKIIAGVVEWYTRATQNRMPQGLRVQVPSPAPMSAANVLEESNLRCFREGT